MTKDQYYMHELIKKYYMKWLNGPTLMEHSLDRKRFYKFAKSCIRYSKHWKAKQDIHGSWLRYFLERDLAGRYNKQCLDEIIHKIVVLFDDILEFNETSFPDYLTEMKDPLKVYMELSSFRRVDKDGREKPYYTDDEIEKILIENFGPSWRKNRDLL